MGKEKKIATYAYCQLCGYLGSYEFHHIIPKRLWIKTETKQIPLYGLLADNKEIQTNVKIKIEDLCIKVCKKCHRKLHPENIYA